MPSRAHLQRLFASQIVFHARGFSVLPLDHLREFDVAAFPSHECCSQLAQYIAAVYSEGRGKQCRGALLGAPSSVLQTRHPCLRRLPISQNQCLCFLVFSISIPGGADCPRSGPWNGIAPAEVSAMET